MFGCGSRITHKCQLEGVTVTQVLKQFPISNADGSYLGTPTIFFDGTFCVHIHTMCSTLYQKFCNLCLGDLPLACGRLTPVKVEVLLL